MEIKGLSVAVASNVQNLNGALKDLGAKTTETEIRIALASDVLFDFDKADLLPKAIPELERPHGQQGLKDYNQKLSERRADSVKVWLKPSRPRR